MKRVSDINSEILIIEYMYLMCAIQTQIALKSRFESYLFMLKSIPSFLVVLKNASKYFYSISYLFFTISFFFVHIYPISATKNSVSSYICSNDNAESYYAQCISDYDSNKEILFNDSDFNIEEHSYECTSFLKINKISIPVSESIDSIDKESSKDINNSDSSKENNDSKIGNDGNKSDENDSDDVNESDENDSDDVKDEDPYSIYYNKPIVTPYDDLAKEAFEDAMNGRGPS
jgi:hypothetical protein